MTIIKFFVFSASWFFIFNQLHKNQYKGLFDNLNIQLLTLPQGDIKGFFSDLIFNKLTEVSILNKIALPLGLNWRLLCDTNYKKFFLLAMIMVVLLYRWFLLFKKFILWPFKLGIFSFIYSILGIDVSWFLSLFNIFTFNIPQWVYFQYLLLYGNWMNWWHNTVNIKSLTISSLPGNKNKLKEVTQSVEYEHKESDNTDSLIVNKKRFYTFLGIVTLIGIGILFYFYYDFSGGANTPPDNSYGDSHQINIQDNTTPDTAETKVRTKAKIKRVSETPHNTFQFKRSLYSDPSGSSFNRFSLLENLDTSRTESPLNPPSPTGSDDSSETIKPGNTVKDLIYSVYNKTRNNK